MDFLAVLGFIMIISFMYLVMSERMSPFSAMIIIPIIFGLIAGAGPGIGKMMMDGVKGVVGTATMLMFSILYFGIMIDAGLFDPLILKILEVVKGDPLKIIAGTVVLSAFMALGGDGSTTFMVVVTTMLPLYKRIGISTVILSVMTLMTTSIFNLVPWGGATSRVLIALNVEVSDVILKIMPGMGLALTFMLVVACIVGKRERSKLGYTTMNEELLQEIAASVQQRNTHLKRPDLFWVNLILTLGLMSGLVFEVAPLAVLFEMGVALALIINYPSLNEQRSRIAQHAPNAINIATIIFSAGIFMGIFSGTKMSDAIALSLINMIPASLSHYMILITALISAPITFLVTNDTYYFAIVPIFAKIAANYGIEHAQIARVSLMGHSVHFLSPLIGSIWLLLGMTEVSLRDLQKYAFPLALGIMTIYILTGIVLGLIPV
ncbi:MAG: citrate transporter [Peptococcaceae bacterium]|nr:citrate transporter [Peptococcaceae bacterium]